MKRQYPQRSYCSDLMPFVREEESNLAKDSDCESSRIKSARQYIRQHIQDMDAYVPGEQPCNGDLCKLNTNENPYPPCPEVISKIKSVIDGRLRLYPDPYARKLRKDLAALHGCKDTNILVGN